MCFHLDKVWHFPVLSAYIQHLPYIYIYVCFHQNMFPVPSSYFPFLPPTSLSFLLLPSPSSYFPFLSPTSLYCLLLPFPFSYFPFLPPILPFASILCTSLGGEHSITCVRCVPTEFVANRNFILRTMVHQL